MPFNLAYMIFFGDNNHIMKTLVKRYYGDIDIIVVLTEKLPDFIVYELKMALDASYMPSCSS